METGLYRHNPFGLCEGGTSSNFCMRHHGPRFTIYMKHHGHIELYSLSYFPVETSLYGHLLSVETGVYGYNQFILCEGKTSSDFHMMWHTPPKISSQCIITVMTSLYGHLYSIDTSLYCHKQVYLFEVRTSFNFCMNHHGPDFVSI